MNILLSDPSVPTEALNENNLITVPCQVMPSLLTSHILTISLYLHTPYAVILMPSHFIQLQSISLQLLFALK